MSREVDVAIIGAGTAGLSALSQVRKRTDSFVIVNEGPYGTTCARVGCMPSKALIEAAHVCHQTNLFEEMGLRIEGAVEVDGRSVLRRVRRLRDRFVAGVLRSTRDLDEKRNIPGRARILAPDLIEAAGERIRTGKLIIATGSKPVVPGPWRELGDSLLTSDNLFELDDLPESLAVVGLGAIGLEMAQAMSMLGVRVEGFDALDGIGGITDPEVAGEAAEIIGGDFPVHTGAKVDLGKTADNEVEVSWNGRTERFQRVLASVGRRPNTEGLGLENLGVELDGSGLPRFDENTLQVEGLPVFIAGDVNGRAPLLHEAADDGHMAGYNAMLEGEGPHRFCRRAPIGIVFTRPCIAHAGLKYDRLDTDDAVAAGQGFRNQGRAMTAGTNRGMLRLYASGSTARLLGAEMVVPSGEHIAHLLSWAVQRELTVFQVLELPFYHPVVEEGVRSAVRKLAGMIDRRDAAPEVPLCDRLPDSCLE